MKNTLFKRIISIALCACTLLSLTAFTVFAEESPLTDFIDNVELIEVAEGLTARERYLYNAEDALELYVSAGGAVTDTAIAEHYAIYLEYKTAIEAEVELHYEFMDEVNLAAENKTGAYPVFKEHLNRAAELLPSLDTSYIGMSASVGLYNGLVFEFKEKEEICDLFIEYAALAKAATTYADADKYTIEADRILANVKIPDYPGLEEAKNDINDVKTFMGKCELAAAPFLAAVNGLHKATNLPRAIKEAYALLEEIDSTTVGVDIALTTLRSEERKYNRAVTEANAAMDEVNELIFSFIY